MANPPARTFTEAEVLEIVRTAIKIAPDDEHGPIHSPLIRYGQVPEYVRDWLETKSKKDLQKLDEILNREGLPEYVRDWLAERERSELKNLAGLSQISPEEVAKTNKFRETRQQAEGIMKKFWIGLASFLGTAAAALAIYRGGLK